MHNREHSVQASAYESVYLHHMPEDDRYIPSGPDPVRLYINEADKVPLLSAEQEVELAMRMEAGLLATAARRLQLARQAEQSPAEARNLYLQAFAASLPKRSLQKVPAAEVTAIRRQAHDRARSYVMGVQRTARLEPDTLETLQADGVAARGHMIAANLRLVITVAKRYPRRGMDQLDLIQHGNLGLIHAVEMFDYQKGFKFSTYATGWIRKYIASALAKESYDISLPTDIDEEIVAMRRTSDRLLAEGKEVTEAAIAREMDMPINRVRKLMGLSEHMFRLDKPMVTESSSRAADDSPSIGTLLADTSFDASRPPEVLDDSRARVIALLQQLDRQSQQMLIAAYGLGDNGQLSHEELAGRFGYARSALPGKLRQVLKYLATVEGSAEAVTKSPD
ncbi:MAG TPA: sigma-70 family RNA polymerase sigma factor [Candidatus Saccharimonadales bacterium]|nr:sigma-70 family RNA polymerase sigma factor [Candidatus Saccharimonadales bacterium]